MSIVYVHNAKIVKEKHIVCQYCSNYLSNLYKTHTVSA